MLRPDGLPHPNSVADCYLAAILGEIRALRKERPIAVSAQSDTEPDVIRVQESGKGKGKRS